MPSLGRFIRMLRQPRPALVTLVVVAACSAPAPQYASVRLTRDAPDAMLTGVAGGPRSAADLVVGCVGFLTEGPPDHVLTLVDAMKLDVVARSARGPVSLAIVGPDGAACDDDTGTGHAPQLSLLAPGRYEVWVAARLSAEARLPYELLITKNDKSRVRLGAPASGSQDVASTGSSGGTNVSVTVTSEPSGAEVRTVGGQVLGTTPAMFVYPATAAELSAPLAFVVAARGQPATRVEGRAQNGELVLHAALAVIATGAEGAGLPGETIQSAVPQRIRDFTTVTQAADYAGDCTIQTLSVTIDVRHTCVSDLRVSLRSPGGVTATLQSHSTRRLSSRTFTLTDSRTALSRFVGQSARGRWEVTVRDDAEVDIGSFESFSMTFTCSAGASVIAVPSGVGARSGAAAGANVVVDPWAANGPNGATVASPVSPPPPRPRGSTGTVRRPPDVVNPWE